MSKSISIPPDAQSPRLSIRQRSLRCLAISMLLIYSGWQAFWLAQGQVPPALFLALTGWPAPTTGGTRSLLALLDGNWRLSFHYNVMLLPMLAVVAVTFGWLSLNLRKLRTLSLPKPIVAAWGIVLAIAWAVKIAQAILDRN